MGFERSSVFFSEKMVDLKYLNGAFIVTVVLSLIWVQRFSAISSVFSSFSSITILQLFSELYSSVQYLIKKVRILFQSVDPSWKLPILYEGLNCYLPISSSWPSARVFTPIITENVIKCLWGCRQQSSSNDFILFNNLFTPPSWGLSPLK